MVKKFLTHLRLVYIHKKCKNYVTKINYYNHKLKTDSDKFMEICGKSSR
jgi:hypothetical protein